jgi:hypothetical protein
VDIQWNGESVVSKGSKRRKENTKAVNDRWPLGKPGLNVMSGKAFNDLKIDKNSK